MSGFITFCFSLYHKYYFNEINYYLNENNDKNNSRVVYGLVFNRPSCLVVL